MRLRCPRRLIIPDLRSVLGAAERAAFGDHPHLIEARDFLAEMGANFSPLHLGEPQGRRLTGPGARGLATAGFNFIYLENIARTKSSLFKNAVLLSIQNNE